jgi:hypothetical protein
MKIALYRIFLTFNVLSACVSFGQESEYQLHLRSGGFVPEKNITESAISALNKKTISSGHKSLVIIQFTDVPDAAEQADLKAKGIELLDYIPNKAYTATVIGDVDFDALTKAQARAIIPIKPGQKMHPGLASGIIPPQAENERGMIDVLIKYPKSYSFDEIKTELDARDLRILSDRFVNYQVIEIRIPIKQLMDIAELPFIQYIEAIPNETKPINDKSKANSRASLLGSPIGGFNLQGSGVVIGIGDESNPMRHIDFTNRLINRTAQKTGSHGLHVTGTAAGGGIVNEKYTGYAPKATILSQYFSNILNSAPAYVQDFGMVITNNSYGTDPLTCYDFGEYILYSSIVDQQALDMPFLQSVFAAGNSGVNTICASPQPGFANILSGFQSAKNVITVGNTSATGIIDPGSSKGPVKDGRIKPEVVAQGTLVTSTIANDAYGLGTGTSMASPTVSGGLALLYERYRNGHGQANPKNALMKALICNGATDLGQAGPDYSYGFGWLNLLRSVKMLDNNNYLSSSVTANVTKEHLITVPANTAQLKVMLYWNDPASSVYTGKVLVNDLNLTVSSTGGSPVVTLPKVLNPANAGGAAINGTDNTNNVEQVVIDNPAGGTYKVSVFGKTIPQNSQEYFVVYDTIQVSTTLTYPTGGERLVAGDEIYIGWDSFGNSGSTFSVQYTTDNGISWIDINTAVAANQRQLQWIIPAVVTSTAKVRITQSGTNAVRESQVFTIAGVPAVRLSPVQCEGSIGLQWDPVDGVTNYEVLILKGSEMKSEAFTGSTSYNIAGLSKDSTYYVTVRAIVNGSPGRRGLAISRIPNTGNCEGNISDNDLKIDAIVSPAQSGRKFTSFELGGETKITIRIKNLDNTVSNQTINVGYSVNGGSIFSEVITPEIPAGGTYEHEFTQKSNFLSTGSYKLSVFANGVNDIVLPNNKLEKTFRQLENNPVALPFSDLLESLPAQDVTATQMGLNGSDRYDFTNTTPFGRVRTFVNTGMAFSGSKAFTLDTDRYFAAGNSNYLTGTYNLAQYNNPMDDIRLTFRFKNHGQTLHPDNRVWIRASETDSWIEVYDLFANQNTPQGTYKLTSSIEISNTLRASNKPLTAGFQVRWGQWGDIITADNSNGAGYTIDDIKLFAPTDDIQLVRIDNPVLINNGLGTTERVRVTVRNTTPHAISNIPVKMQIDQGNVIQYNISSIDATTNLIYEFPQNVNLSAIGNHVVKVWVDLATDNYPDNNTVELKFYNSGAISSYPYLQTFDTDNDYYHSEGKNNSWTYGIVASTKINKAASGRRAWKTNLTGNYKDNEISYLYTPTFSLNGLQNPTLSFSAALDIEDCPDQTCDVAFVEYSTNGNTWSLLGAKGLGTNWYDETNNGKDAWSAEDYTRWHVSTIPIPTGSSNIRFRFVFQSNGQNTREGVAIDDIHVYDLKNGIYSATANSSTVTKTGVSGTNWINFTDNNKIIASIMPNSLNLGSTDVKTYINTGNVRSNSGQYYLDRNFTIKPSNTNFGDYATVRLYFTDAESERLLAATGCALCDKPTSAYGFSISKYSSSNTSTEDGDISNDINQGWTSFAEQEVVKVPYDNGYYAEFLIKTFSEFWLAKGSLGASIPLPVELISFKASKKTNSESKQDVLLEWATSEEKKFSHFEAEVAIGTDQLRQNIFTKIGEVTGSGSSASELKYTYTDYTASTTETRYYRLKMVDLDGTYKYSTIRSVTFEEKTAARLYPNPSTGIFNLELSSDKTRNSVYSIYDLNGRLMKRSVLSPTGTLQKQKIDLTSSDFASGLYMLELVTGQEKQVFKVMKN